MKNTPDNVLKRSRFEVTIKTIEGQKKHVCAAVQQSDAVDRILKIYSKIEPELTRVTELGVLPKKRKTKRRITDPRAGI